MSKHICAACGKEIIGGVGIGGIILCAHPCADEVREEIDHHRVEGRMVDAGRIALQLYRQHHVPRQIKGVPTELWIAARAQAVTEGITMGKLVTEALKKRIGGIN